MILSVSRRTDIPAFYSEWFFRRLSEGFVDAINPFNRKQVSRISLRPEDVDCIVFWTKNPAPMLKYLDRLQDYAYYFQFTLTAYQKDVEPGLPLKRELIETFRALSEHVGPDRVIWRYDPIFLNDTYTLEYHTEWFGRFAEALAPFTKRCVISFIDLYQKTERNTKALRLHELTTEEMETLAAALSAVAQRTGLELVSCAEEIDLDAYGIRHGACIDKTVIERVLGRTINVKKDPTQRQVCGCMKSVDIGQYNTCPHLCRYCYANFNAAMAEACYGKHDPAGTILSGKLLGDEKITERKVEHLVKGPVVEQGTLDF